MTWIDYCHKCRKMWTWEEGKDDKEHEKRFIEHAMDGHVFTTYDPNSKKGRDQARLAGVPMNGRK